MEEAQVHTTWALAEVALYAKTAKGEAVSLALDLNQDLARCSHVVTSANATNCTTRDIVEGVFNAIDR
jgi:hypothetical protein